MSSLDNSLAVRQLEDFEQLITSLEELTAISPYLKQTGCTIVLRQLAAQLAQLPEENLPLTSPWLQLASAVTQLKEKIPAPITSAAPVPSRAICTPTACPNGTSQSEVDDMLIAVAAADIATAIAQGVAAAIPQEIAGFTHVAYIAALVVATALDVVAKGLALDAAILQKAANETAACEEAAFQEVVYSMCGTINEIKASLDSLHNKVDLIDRKINSLLAMVAQLIALVTELLLREIEENLAECRTLTSLYLPRAAGGRLENVQTLVQDLIHHSVASGLPTGAAQSYLKQGVASYREQDYCQALEWYTQAYRQLAENACCRNTVTYSET